MAAANVSDVEVTQVSVPWRPSCFPDRPLAWAPESSGHTLNIWRIQPIAQETGPRTAAAVSSKGGSPFHPRHSLPGGFPRDPRKPPMEKSTPIGLVAGLMLIYGAIFMGEGWQTFFDPASLVLVLGGTAAALLVGFSFSEIKQIPAGLKDFFSFAEPELPKYAGEFTELCRVARREGLLALDRRIKEMEDELMRLGLELAVDGKEAGEADELMRTWIGEEAKRRHLVAKFFTEAGTAAPTFGMIGTLIGLIKMMQNLADPSQIGAGMAVALITTFYGALFANLIFLPFATKMKAQTGHVMKLRELVRTGIIAIIQGESPTAIEQRLQLFTGESGGDDKPAAPPLAKAA